MIRVLIVDDSPLACKALTRLLGSDPEIRVAATAGSGELALQMLATVKPDVITMDLEMPGIGGMETIRRIMDQSPISIVVLSALNSTELTLQALELGAVDFVTKPSKSPDGWHKRLSSELVAAVKQASLVKPRIPAVPVGIPPVAGKEAGPGLNRRFEAVAVGASTGGPVALREVLAGLSQNYPLGILVVQHMPSLFTAAFAKRLSSLCRISVTEATGGEVVAPGHAYIAPGDRHMSVEGSGGEARIRLDSSRPVNGHRPSIDVLANSVAAAYGARGLGLIMTGMGRDGAEGMGAIRRRGGYVIAQDQASSVIYGMNKAVIESGDAHEVLPLGRIAGRLREIAVSAPSGRDGP